TPPSAPLLGALGVLRRPAAAQDALPEEALNALKARGLAPVDPASARLLRTTPEGGRAWIVPVPDVGVAGLVPCVPKRAGRTPLKPQEGVAVVATGGAPTGGGAALGDLVRGRGTPGVDTCAGPNRDMLGVSGVVPDGVGAAFLTAPDGTAVRADVVDNGYAFVVPRGRTPQLRYVVWTGGDGTPHVQPVPTAFLPRGVRCPAPVGVRVSPEGGACRLGQTIARPPMAVPARPRRPSRHRAAPVLPRPTVVTPVPQPVAWQIPCAPGVAVPVEVPPIPTPAPARPPRVETAPRPAP
ncbi:MAG: hypothetical protein QOG77_1591, partial [Solirubrobacteraceae bacterium]|nr:hypothetical protein [Solirubrobacteraceae bacterium]